MNQRPALAITNTAVIVMMGIVIIITTKNPVMAIAVGIIIILAAITELMFYRNKTLSDSMRNYCMTCTTIASGLLFFIIGLFLELRCFS